MSGENKVNAKKFALTSKLSVVLTAVVSNIFVIGGVAVKSADASTVTSIIATNQSVACVATSESGHISGIVSDTSSGTKVPYTAGARVRLLDTDNGTVLACVIADANGRYSIETDRRGAGVAIVVDPVDGSVRSLGSSGGPVRITSTPMVRDYSIGVAKWAGIVRMSTVDGELSPTGTYVCLSGQGFFSRCGFVLPRSSGDGLRWAITDAGIEGLQHSIESSYGSGTSRSYGYADINSVSNPLGIEIISYIESAYSGPSNGCAVGEEPNITGQVTNGEAGYVTRVVLGEGWGSYSSSTTPNIHFYSDYIWTNSAADGTFGFCRDVVSDNNDEESMPTVLQVQANVADFTRDVSLGATKSQWLSSACLLSTAGCDLGSFAMAEKVLWGRVTADRDRDASTTGTALAGARIDIYPTNWEDSNNNWGAHVVTDSNGRWALADAPTTGSYNFQTYPEKSCQSQLVCTVENDENRYLVPKSSNLVRNANSQEFNVEISAGNFSARMLDPEWMPLSSRAGSYLYAYVDSTYCLAPANRDTELWDTTCRIGLEERGYANGEMLSVGILPQGKYIIIGAAGGYAFSFAKVSVNSSLQVTIDEGSIRQSESGIFELAASNGNLRFKLIRPDTNSRVTGISYYTSSSTSPSTGQNIRPDQNGDLIWNVTEGGEYRVQYSYADDNPSTIGVVAKSFHFKIEVSNSGIATIKNQCTSATSGTVCEESPPSIVDGQYQLTMDLANFKVSVCSLPNNEPCGSGYRDLGGVSMQKVLTGFNSHSEVSLSESNGVFYGKIARATAPSSTPVTTTPQTTTTVGSLGATSTSTTALDVYELKIYAPYNNSNLWVPIIRYVSIDSNGVIKSCATRECTSSTPISFNESSGTYDLGELRYSTGNVVGRVLKPGTSSETVGRTNGSVRLISSTNSSGEWFRTNKDGRFSLQLPPGTYELSAEPPYNRSLNSSDVYTTGRSTIVVGSDGQLVGSADVRLTEPNLQGFVRAGSQNVPYSYVQIQQWNTVQGYWEWKPGVSTRDTGAYAVNLEEGKWRLRVSPSGQFARDFADGELIVNVSESGQISAEDGTLLSGSVNISLQVPNVKFVLSTPGINYAGLDIQFFDTVRNYFQYVSNSSISSSNGVAAKLQTGRYRVNINPWNNPEFVQTEKFIKVNSNGQVCVLANQTSTDCAPGSFLESPAEISLSLNGPNLRGTVVRGEGGAGTGAHIQIEKYDSTQKYFQWVSWAYANSTGQFSTRLQPGWYKLTANPYEAGSGFSRTVTYVVVYEPDSDGDTWCRPAAATSPAPCAEANGALYGADDNFSFALEPSNIRATVRYSGQPITDGWVSVSRKVNNDFQWLDVSAHVSRGELGMVLPVGAEPTQYRLTINPPYSNPFKLGKKRVTLWVGDFVPGGRTDDVCLQLQLSSGQTCDAANVRSSGALFTIDMTTANVAGKVLHPTVSSTKMHSSSLEVRVWLSGHWQWTDNYVSSDLNGEFAVNLDSGTYQITARAPWNAVDALTNSDPVQITVQEDGSWCLDPNPTSSECDQGDISSLLSISLGIPNLVATLKSGTTPIPNSWVNVSVAETNAWGNWWRWIDKSVSSNQNGKFAVDLSEDGKYRIDVHPPHFGSDGIQLVRFSTYFRVKNGGICRGETCEDDSTYVSSLDDEVLNFPVPNLVGTVKESGGTTLRDAWIQVEKWAPVSSTDGYWNWTDTYAQSNSAGNFALLLSSAGKYRVKVNPPWNSSTLPRFSKIVNVDAEGKVCIGESCTPSNSSLAADFVFPLPNITGNVLLKQGADPVLSKWSWIGASKGPQYDWSNTNVNGDFGMYLEDGDDWSLWFYPDYSKSNAQPMNVRATISNGQLTSWRYSFEAAGTNHCLPVSSSPCRVNVAFDYVPPNFKVLVSFETAAVAGAFVRMTQVDDASKVFDFVTNEQGLVTGNIPVAQYAVSVVDAVGAQTRTGTSSITVGSETEILTQADVAVSVQVPSG